MEIIKSDFVAIQIDGPIPLPEAYRSALLGLCAHIEGVLLRGEEEFREFIRDLRKSCEKTIERGKTR